MLELWSGDDSYCGEDPLCISRSLARILAINCSWLWIFSYNLLRSRSFPLACSIFIRNLPITIVSPRILKFWSLEHENINGHVGLNEKSKLSTSWWKVEHDKEKLKWRLCIRKYADQSKMSSGRCTEIE